MPQKKIAVLINGRKRLLIPDIPLSASLYEANIYGYYKSIKYHRIRGFLSLDWTEPSRIYTNLHPASNPSLLNTDSSLIIDYIEKIGFKDRIIGLISKYLRVGFQNKFPFNNIYLWQVFSRLIKKTLPHPKPRFIIDKSRMKKRIYNVNCDVLVVGGGISGLAVAIECAKVGAKTILINGEDKIGGHLTYINTYLPALRRSSMDLINGLHKEALTNNVKILNKLILEGFLEDSTIGYNYETKEIYLFNYKSMILATGARFIPTIFENNDLPKVYLGSACLRLNNLYNIRPGSKGLVIGINYWGLSIAENLSRNNIEVTVVDKIKEKEYNYTFKYPLDVRDSKINIIFNANVIRAEGRHSVNKVVLDVEGEKVKMNVDFIAMASIRSPSIELAGQLRLKMGFHIDLGGFIPLHDWYGKTNIENIYIAGELGGVIPEDAVLYLSKAVGLSSCQDLGLKVDLGLVDDYINLAKEILKAQYPRLFEALDTLIKNYSKNRVTCYFNNAITWHMGKEYKQFICPCLDITVSDIKLALNDLGKTNIEYIKRYSGIGTGRCQGKYCILNTIIILSEITKEKPINIGLPRFRFPVVPLDFSCFEGVDG